MRLSTFSLCQGCKSPDEFINIFKELTFGPLDLCCDFVIHQFLFSSFTSFPLLPFCPDFEGTLCSSKNYFAFPAPHRL